MIFVLVALAVIAGLYQLVSLVASLAWLIRSAPASTTGGLPAVSVLKPVHGLDAGLADAIRSHARQQGPEFEVLLGTRDPNDAAIPEIRRVAREFPGVALRLIPCHTETPNGKVGVLMDLAREARYPVLVVNDADISVPAGYLEHVTAPLADPRVGLVTCLYRASAQSWPARCEALAIATEFAPSVLVAPLFGVDEFGLGATLAFRASDLKRIGGFAAVADYVADDYQLGRQLHALGLKCVLAGIVVETHSDADSWGALWQHQLRWARTIRVSRPGGYWGLPVTHATLWAMIAAVAGQWAIALPLLGVRLAAAIAAGWGVLRSRDVLRCFLLIPLRDLLGVAVWFAGLFGNTVIWRGQRIRLTRDGRITPGH